MTTFAPEARPELTGFFKPDKPKPKPRPTPRPPPNTPESTDVAGIVELQVKKPRPCPRPPPNTPESTDVAGIVELQVKNPRPGPPAGGNGGNPPPDILALEGDFNPRVPSPGPLPGPRPKPGPTKPVPEPMPRISEEAEIESGKPKGDPIPQGPVGPGRPEIEAAMEVVVGA